jgi:membrane-bound serine protease (ClpP class)
MMELFVILLISGLMMIGAEVFIPGGILGFIGGLVLLGASVLSFSLFSTNTSILISAGIVVMIGVVIFLWIKIFPRTPIGKAMTVSRELNDAKGTEDHLQELLGLEGVATSHLHPAGFASIKGRRVDVVSQGPLIDANTKVRVIEIEGNRVVVAEIK